MSRKLVRLKDSGHFDGEPKLSGDGKSLEKPMMLVYAGDFESMDGPVTISDDDIEKLASNHNSMFAKLSRLATGEVHPRHNPPLQLDHSTSARDTVGRVVGNVSVGEHTLEDGKKVKALMGTARILGADNIEKVNDGRWVHLSGGFDMENHKINEATITPFPAAGDAHLLSKRRLHKDTKYMDHDIRTYPTNDGTNKWRWDTRWSSGVEDDEAKALAAAKKSIDDFHKFNPELRAWMSDIKRMSDVALPGHPDEALWDKAKRAYEHAVQGGSKIDDKYAFIMNWYKEQGGKLSQGEDTMGYKELKDKAALYEKCRKHLTEHKKMSEEDADKHLEAAKDEELKKMAAEHDEHLKHLAEEDAKKREHEEGLKKHMASHKPALVKLAGAIKDMTGSARLAVNASKINVRLGKLRAEAKLSPAEIKLMKVDELAGKTDEAIEAALSSYEKRTPIIDAGLIGSPKALNAGKLSARLRQLNMEKEELQTRLNMPSKRDEALKRLAEIEEKEKHLEYMDPAAHMHGEDEHHMDFEAAHAHYRKLMEEGKHDEAKEHMLSYMAKHMKRMEEPGSQHVPDPTPHMSALAGKVKSMQNDFVEFVKLTAPSFGATVEELT